LPPAAFLTAEQLGGAKTIGRQVRSEADLARAVELGFPTATIDALRKRGVTDRDIAALIIKPRTLSHRRAQRSRLTVDESDRAVRLARARAFAEEAFADTHKADRWLHRELTALEGRRPIDLIRTQVGARMVEDLLASIAWGAAL
jgi:putative toxin-antitoxin system antitoxin component (TIGR02293 family)